MSGTEIIVGFVIGWVIGVATLPAIVLAQAAFERARGGDA